MIPWHTFLEYLKNCILISSRGCQWWYDRFFCHLSLHQDSNPRTIHLTTDLLDHRDTNPASLFFFVIIAAFQDESKRPAAFFKTWQEKEIFGLRPVRENLFKCGQIYFLASPFTLLLPWMVLEMQLQMGLFLVWCTSFLSKCRHWLLFENKMLAFVL